MNRKSKGQCAVVAGASLLGVGLVAACGQGPGAEPEPTATDALSTVIDCQTQAGTCLQSAKTASAATTCNATLRSCLMSLFADAGRPTFPAFDAAFPPPITFPRFDGGLTLPPLPFPRFDAGAFPRPPAFDAGLPPFPRFDAGPPVPPQPRDAGVPANFTCLQDLQTCLGSKTTPTTCADQARTCLTAAQHAQCLAQEAQCEASGVPKAACTALTRGCP
ncbi:MAG TPA: hypothetical protein VKU41_02150 [Polyangiaceae bacterium]|nr:hypothetical protein [Polyangiaceae bacterium]